ncbi:hypothetical protein K8R33_02795 [archaeon]|nr:hypothetical protein [archaeon]
MERPEYIGKALKLSSVLLGVVCLIIMLLFLLVLNVSATEFIDPNTCYYENISVGLNETYNSTIEVCCNNGTYSISDINVDLTPGSTEEFTEDLCHITASCSSCDCEASPNKCIYEETLRPGETETHQSSVCDIEVKCRECDCEEEINELYDYEVEYSFYYDKKDNYFKIEFHNKTIISDNDEDWSNLINIKGKIPFECPGTISEDSPESILKQCKDVVPVYCTEMSGLLIGQNKACNEDLRGCRAENKDITGLVCVPTKEYSELVAEHNLTNGNQIVCAEKEGRLETQLKDSKETNFVLFFIIVLLGGFNGVLVAKLKKGKMPKVHY